MWPFNGGMTTIQALRELKSEDETFVDREYVFVHAGIAYKVPLDKQNKNILLWAHEKFFEHYDGEAVVISGHSPVKLSGRNIVMIDTGSFVRGSRKISCVDILNGVRYGQAKFPDQRKRFESATGSH